jgi:P2 family phage major capsid protein
MVPVDELKGEKVGLGVSGTIAGRTNTDSTERSPRDVAALSADGFEAKKTDFDTAVKYAMLDMWAKFPDFQARLAGAILERQALDRIMIGWHGTSAAATTNRTNNPKLEDVNIGWLEHIRTNAPDQVMDEGAVANKVTYGPAANADYKTLDALVYDNIQRLFPWWRDDQRIRAICSRDLMHDKLFPLVNENSNKPTEANAADMILSQKRLGGLQAVQVPQFPTGTMLLTLPKNLAIYWQLGGRRRMVVDNPRRDRIETYDSSNEAYVVEDYEAVVLIENIEFAE